MFNIKNIFPEDFYSESEVYEIADANFLQVQDTSLNTFKVLEIIGCDHGLNDCRLTGRYTDCDLDDENHEVLGEFRNDHGDGTKFYLNDFLTFQ
jgi:hypothetical protein